ncbi:MAG: SPOR domain-containing protein [Candidatus Omnitrophota bacterium]
MLTRKAGLFIICCLWFGIFNNIYALNIEQVKVYFLSGDYKSAILEGEKLLAKSGANPEVSELYYILGLSYLKDGNYLRASDIFEIIIDEFKNSRFIEESIMGLGDTYFFKGDYTKAESYYKDLINKSPKSKLLPQAYYRLSECAAKIGNTKVAEDYLAKLKKDYPLNLEIKSDNDLGGATLFYTVQVGSFSKPANAQNLANKLLSNGYDAYTVVLEAAGNKSYRVRVGKLQSRLEASQLENKLSLEGYPTKIFP